MKRFLIALYDNELGGPPKAWACSQSECERVCRTRLGMLRHLRQVHKLNEQEYLFDKEMIKQQ